MDEAELKRKLLEIAAPIVAARDLDIWGLEIAAGPRMTARLFVEAPAGAAAPGIDECEKISRQLDLALDAAGMFAKPWTLEVSTPGFARRFFAPAQMAPYIGDMIQARLAEPLAGYPGSPATLRGRLLSLDGALVTLEPCAIGENGEIRPENLPPASFRFEDARRVSRMDVYAPPPKPGGKKPGKSRPRDPGRK